VYVDPRDLSLVQYEQRTPTDSAVVAKKGTCITGWVDLDKAARRTVACDRFTDRFAGTPMDEHLVPLLPLHPGPFVLATYSAISSAAGSYDFNVAGEDTLTVAGKPFRAWRVERRLTSPYGTYVTTLWIDRARPRLLRADRDFGNGRRSTTTARHP
jgi:hypothetical protein